MKKNEIEKMNIKVDKLNTKTKKELLEIAKGYQIIGRHDAMKDELIKAIVVFEMKQPETPIHWDVLTKEFDNLIILKEETPETETQKKVESEVSATSATEYDDKKLKYIANMKIGTLIAFKISKDRALSAKVTKLPTNNHVGVEAKDGKLFEVSLDDIIWVRTGARWPKGVWQLLKGVQEGNERGERKAATYYYNAR